MASTKAYTMREQFLSCITQVMSLSYPLSGSLMLPEGPPKSGYDAGSSDGFTEMLPVRTPGTRFVVMDVEGYVKNEKL